MSTSSPVPGRQQSSLLDFISSHGEFRVGDCSELLLQKYRMQPPPSIGPGQAPTTDSRIGFRVVRSKPSLRKPKQPNQLTHQLSNSSPGHTRMMAKRLVA
jgi:hypothetical protein